MIKLPVFALLLCYGSFATAQGDHSGGAKLLFEQVDNILTPAEQNTLYQQTGFKLSKDKKQFVAADDAAAEYPFDTWVYATDLNKDGKAEIFIVYGNTYTSGATGSNVLMFIKDKNGRYQSNFGFPGTVPDILPTANMGYPDILIGGPGFEFPIWRWNGRQYDLHRRIKDTDLEKVKTISVEDASKAYMGTVKK